MVQSLVERRGLTLEHARGWIQHVGLETPLDQIEGEADLVAAVRQTLEDGVHQIADTVRNSLNFYRMQENAETVEPRRPHGARGRRSRGSPSACPSSCRCRSSRPSSRPARRAPTWAV